MTEYWPNVKAYENTTAYDDFWDHEWTKHGTCSGLDQFTYFNTTISLLQQYGTPQVFQDAVGSTMAASTLRDAFGGPTYASLQCTSTKFINGVYWCFERDAVTYLPGKQIVCPSDVQKEDTCSSATLTVDSF
jgi:ribonuclease T2